MSPPPLPRKDPETYCFPLVSVRLSVTKSCPIYNLKTSRDVSTKLQTLVKHIQTTCHAQEPELCFGYFGVFPFDHLRCYFVSALQLDNRWRYFNETSCICIFSTFRRRVKHKNHNSCMYVAPPLASVRGSVRHKVVSAL